MTVFTIVKMPSKITFLLLIFLFVFALKRVVQIRLLSKSKKMLKRAKGSFGCSVRCIVPLQSKRIITLLDRIANSLSRNCKLCIRFRQGGAIKDSHNTVFTTTLPQTQTGRRRVSDDVTTDWFVIVLGK